jgi:hypothetical protein
MAHDEQLAPLLALRLEGGGRGDAEELYDVLSKDELLGPHVRALSPPMRSDALGPGGDILAIAVEEGPLIGVVALALVKFVEYRTTDIAISVVRPDGTEVKGTVRVHGKRAVELEKALVDEIRGNHQDDPPAGSAEDG